MSDSSISVRIGADAGGFRAGAQEAGHHVDALSDKLKEFRSHVRTEARYTRFLGDQIENLGIVSDGAAGAIGHLAAGLAFGGALGVAIAGVKVLAEVIHSIGEESAKETEALKKLAESSKTFIEGQAKALEDFLAALEGESAAQTIARKEARPLLEEETRLTGQLSAARTALQAATEEQVLDEQGLARQMFEQARATKEITKLEADLAIVRANLGAVRKRVGGTAAGEDAKADVASEEARRKIQLAQSIADAQSQADRVTVENSINLSALKANQEIAQLKLTAQQKEALIAEVAAAQARADEASEESGRNLLTIQVAQEQEARAQVDALADEAKEAKEIGKASLEMGQAAGEAFLGMIDGSKSVEDSLLQLIAQMVKAALQMAALREIASGDFIGGGILAAGSVIAGGLGSLTGGGGGSNLTVNMNNSFHGNALDAANSHQFQTAVISTIRMAQRRGRL